MMQHIPHHAEQQQQPPPTEQPNNYYYISENNNNNNNDYLQILDAGEHMYKMFVAEDEDLYAYLRNNNNNEDLFEDALLSHDDEDDLQRIDGLDLCCDNYYCDNTSDQSHNKNFTENSSNHCNTSDDERSATAGRMSPTQTEDHHDDAIIE